MLLYLSTYCLFSSRAAQPQDLDPSFLAPTNGMVINDLLMLPDGTIAFAGNNPFKFGTISPDGGTIQVENFGAIGDSGYSLATDGTGASLVGGYARSFTALARYLETEVDGSFLLASELRYGTQIVSKVLLQGPGEQMVACGSFVLLGSTNRFGVARFTLAGRRDPTFNLIDSQDIAVYCAAQNPRGEIFAGYTMTNSQGTVIYGFGHWSADGLRDTNYSTGWLTQLGSDARVSQVAAEPGGTGFYASIETGSNAAIATRLVHLNAAGVPIIDSEELPTIAGTVKAIAFCPAGSPRYDQLLVGGDFRRVAQAECNNFVSFSPTGTVLYLMAPSSGPDGPIHGIAAQSDGRILICGAFTNIGGKAATGIARLTGLAAAGRTYLYWDDNRVTALQSAGSIEVGLNRQGRLDEALRVELQVIQQAAAPATLTNVAITFEAGQARKLVSLPIAQFGSERTSAVRIDLDGGAEADLSYTPEQITIVNDSLPGTREQMELASLPNISALLSEPDGSVLVAYATDRSPNLIRLRADGSLDPEFVTTAIRNVSFGFGRIHHLALSPEGKIFATGTFETTNNWGPNFLARLNRDGSLDSAFQPQISFMGSVYGSDALNLGVDSDGSTILAVSPDLTSLSLRNFSSVPFPIRLSPSGSIAGGFPFDYDSLRYKAWHIEVTRSRQVLMAGRSPTNTYGLFKFSDGGSADTNFVVRTGGEIFSFTQPDEGVLVAGSFTNINNVPAAGLAWVDSTSGAVVALPDIHPDGRIHQVLRRADGKIYIAGEFIHINGLTRYHVARVNSDGTLDRTYDPGFTFRVEPTIALQTDGRLIGAEGFFLSSTFANSRLVRLVDDPSSGQLALSSDKLSVTEGSSYVEIGIDRLGGSTGTLSGELRTIDGSALSNRDYLGTNLVITFADGEYARKTVRIPIFSHPEFTGNRTFAVSLSGNSGAVESAGTVLLLDEQNATSPAGPKVTLGGDGAVIRDFALLPGGSVLVAGRFTSIQNVAVTNLARLNPDLSVDPTFAVKEEILPELSLVVVRDDGRIIVGGAFDAVGRHPWARLIQLGSQGTVDAEYNDQVAKTCHYLGSVPTDLKLGPDNTLFAAGDAGWIRRIGEDGTCDWELGLDYQTLISLLPQADGGVLIGVQQTFRDPRNAVWRYNSDGRVDTNFPAFRDRFGEGVRLLVPDRDEGAVAISSSGYGLVHLPRSGEAQTIFARLASGPKGLQTVLPLAGGDFLVGGDFQTGEFHAQTLLARLRPDGYLRDFSPDIRGTRIQKVAQYPDGSLLVLGSVTNVAGVDTGPLFKLRLTNDLPPVVQFLWPTNGIIVGSDVAGRPSRVSVQAFDADGFLESVVLELDGTPFATNRTGNFLVPNFPVAGTHLLTATARDEVGLETTTSIEFTMTGFGLDRLTIERKPNGRVLIHLPPFTVLEESEDLITWHFVSETTSDVTIAPGTARMFYRSRR